MVTKVTKTKKESFNYSNDDKYLTMSEACKYLSVNRHTLMKYINEKSLKAYKIGGEGRTNHYRIRLSDIENFIKGIVICIKDEEHICVSDNCMIENCEKNSNKSSIVGE